jgi:hypothetical protein
MAAIEHSQKHNMKRLSMIFDRKGDACRFSDICMMYAEDSHTCNHDSEARTYCGISRTMVEA